MIDIVYPLGSGSVWLDNEELRYSLRSIEAHISNFGKIFVVGKKLPSWAKDITLIPATDEAGGKWKDRNIFRKIILACESDEVSDDFLFMNDDHYFIKNFSLPELPYFYREIDMQETIEKSKNQNAWSTSIKNTRNFLIENGYDVKMFDTHTPIVYNKHRFHFVSKADWDVPYGYGIKSLYCNINRIEGVMEKDGKIFPSEMNPEKIMAKISNKPCFSSSSYVTKTHEKIIMSMFPFKSRWEI